MIRFLTMLVTVLGGLYGGYWFVGSTAVERGAAAWLDGLRDQGVEVAYSDLRTIGFPSRFDTTLTNPVLRDPASGFGWRAPFIQVFALSYRPNKVIAVWPHEQEFLLPGQSLFLRSADMRASASVAAAAALPLDTVTLEVTTAEVTANTGWQLDFARALLAFRDAGASPGQYDAYGEVTGIALPQETLQRIDPARRMPVLIDRLRLDAALGFDRPIDRFAGQAGGPRLETLTLRDLRLVWGTVEISATADLRADATGLAEGTITLRAVEWDRIVPLAVDAGLLDAGLAEGLQRAGRAMADGSGRIDAVIDLRGGFMSWGPLPLGPAPRLQ